MLFIEWMKNIQKVKYGNKITITKIRENTLAE